MQDKPLKPRMYAQHWAMLVQSSQFLAVALGQAPSARTLQIRTGFVLTRKPLFKHGQQTIPAGSPDGVPAGKAPAAGTTGSPWPTPSVTLPSGTTNPPLTGTERQAQTSCRYAILLQGGPCITATDKQVLIKGGHGFSLQNWENWSPVGAHPEGRLCSLCLALNPEVNLLLQKSTS